MTEPTTLDPILYIRTPRLDIPGSISLGKMLVSNALKDASPVVREAARELRFAG